MTYSAFKPSFLSNIYLQCRLCFFYSFMDICSSEWLNAARTVLLSTAGFYMLLLHYINVRIFYRVPMGTQ